MQATAAPAASPAQSAAQPGQLVLYDMPVSNNGGRVRYVVYKKGLEGEVAVRPPADLGGLKAEAYLALNPQGKMPLLVLPDGTGLPESEVIVQYLVDKYQGRGPSMVPGTPELRARALLLSRNMDIYVHPIQACMYRAADIQQRADQIAQLAKQLDVLEGLLLPGPYAVGDEPSTADAAMFPTFTFMVFMLPQFFGWRDVFAGRPKLAAWWKQMESDPEASRVIQEIRTALQGWKESGRWDKVGILEQVKDNTYKWAY